MQCIALPGILYPLLLAGPWSWIGVEKADGRESENETKIPFLSTSFPLSPCSSNALSLFCLGCMEAASHVGSSSQWCIAAAFAVCRPLLNVAVPSRSKEWHMRCTKMQKAKGSVTCQAMCKSCGMTSPLIEVGHFLILELVRFCQRLVRLELEWVLGAQLLVFQTPIYSQCVGADFGNMLCLKQKWNLCWMRTERTSKHQCDSRPKY